MFVVSVVRAGVANDFRSFKDDPGTQGMNTMAVVFTIYALIPMLLCLFDGRFFRWAMLVPALLFFLMFFGHQLGHMVVDKTPLGIDDAMNFGHHALLLWIIVCTVRWARLAAAPQRTGALAVAAK